jgi:hypothetical protein
MGVPKYPTCHKKPFFVAFFHIGQLIFDDICSRFVGALFSQLNIGKVTSGGEMAILLSDSYHRELGSDPVRQGNHISRRWHGRSGGHLPP